MKISIDSINSMNSIVWIVSIHVVFKFMNVLGIIWIDFHEMSLFPIFSFYQVALYHLANILPTSCQHLANILPGSKRKKEEKPQPTVDRKLALLKLRDVACSGLREALWQDAEALSRWVPANSGIGSLMFDCWSSHVISSGNRKSTWWKQTEDRVKRRQFKWKHKGTGNKRLYKLTQSEKVSSRNRLERMWKYVEIWWNM